jgi:hypothetical protein
MTEFRRGPGQDRPELASTFTPFITEVHWDITKPPGKDG